MREQVETKQTLVAQAAGLSAELIRVAAGTRQERVGRDPMGKSGPRKARYPALYGKINALAKDAHLAISRFDPQPFVRPREAARDSDHHDLLGHVCRRSTSFSGRSKACR